MAAATGYAKLATFMAGEQYEIFRKFKSSACRDLLYLQAELKELEDEFAALSERDRETQGEHELYDGNWLLLSTSEARNCGGDQWAKALQIRDECVSQYSAIANTPQASRRDVKLLREWILRPDLGGGILFSGADLNPLGSPVYHDNYSTDLMTLGHRTGEDDPFTRLLSGPVFHGLERVWRIFKFKRPVPADPEKAIGTSKCNLFRYTDSHVLGVIDILGTILASMTPLVSIIILYFVQNLGVRLVVVCIFTLIFSVSLALVTKARRIEVFACTAAFASVQVVFLGTTNNSYASA